MREVLLFMLFIIGIAVFTNGGRSQEITPLSPEPTIEPAELFERAQQALESAEAANARTEQLIQSAELALGAAQGTTEQSANTLDYIQTVFSILSAIGLILGVGLGALGLRTYRDYQSRLSELSLNLEAFLSEAESTGKAVSEGFEDSIRNMQARFEKSIRAFNLQQLGESQLSTGNRTQMIETYVEAFNLDPSSQTLNYRLAELYLIDRDIDRAIMHIDLALEADPNFAPALATKGYALRIFGDSEEDFDRKNLLFSQAETLLLQALERQPKLRNLEGESIYGTLGGLYRRQLRYSDAISAYEKASQVTPQNSYPFINIASLYALQGNNSQARSYYKRTLELSDRSLSADPFDHWSRIDRSIALLYLEEKDQALKEFRQVCEDTIAPHFLDGTLSLLQQLRNAPNSPNGYEEAIQLLNSFRQSPDT